MVAGEPGAADVVVGEPRWHMASAVVAAIVLTILMPDRPAARPSRPLPLVEGGLLVALIVGDPGKIDRRTVALRRLSLGLVSVLILGALWATAVLTSHLIQGGKETNSAARASGSGCDCLGVNVLAFALLYWELDGGGASERAHRLFRPRGGPGVPAADGPEPRAPTVAPWLCRLPVLGFTNATAFSPTDAMPLAPWAKVTMATQALISLVLLQSGGRQGREHLRLGCSSAPPPGSSERSGRPSPRAARYCVCSQLPTPAVLGPDRVPGSVAA